MPLLTFTIPDLGNQIKQLVPTETLSLEQGRDHLDYISYYTYGSYDYWTGLAYYNDVIVPFSLISQGITSIQLFDKNDYDLLIKELSNA